VLEQRVVVDVASNRRVQLRSPAMTLQALERLIPELSKFVRCGTSP
jgi:hypothetical protein